MKIPQNRPEGKLSTFHSVLWILENNVPLLMETRWRPDGFLEAVFYSESSLGAGCIKGSVVTLEMRVSHVATFRHQSHFVERELGKSYNRVIGLFVLASG